MARNVNKVPENANGIVIPDMSRDSFEKVLAEIKMTKAVFFGGNKTWYFSQDDPNYERIKEFIRVVKEQDSLSKENPTSFLKEDSYQGYAYIKKDKETDQPKPKILYGNSPEDIIGKLQMWNTTRKESVKFKTCYVRKLNVETNKYETLSRYDVESGKDITPIFLSLPHMDSNSFQKVTAELKKNGARYSEVKKAWYITKENDLNLFAKYLPLPGTDAEMGDSRKKSTPNYELETSHEYYDNRVKVRIGGSKEVNIYGDDYGVHFPSMSREEQEAMIEKFVIPNIHTMLKEAPKREYEVNGKKYNALQYNVLDIALNKPYGSNPDYMMILENPELTSVQMNELRWAMEDGLSVDQVKEIASGYQSWQMDLLRVAMDHGLTAEDIKAALDPTDFSQEEWSKRRNMVQKMCHAADLTNQQYPIYKKSLCERLQSNQKEVSNYSANESIMARGSCDAR